MASACSPTLARWKLGPCSPTAARCSRKDRMVSGRKERWLCSAAIGVPQKSLDLRAARRRPWLRRPWWRARLEREPELAERRMSAHVWVVDDGQRIVVEPVAVEAVEVGGDGHAGDE